MASRQRATPSPTGGNANVSGAMTPAVQPGPASAASAVPYRLASRPGPRPNPFQEQGATGLRHYSGRLYEEFLPDLYGSRAAQVYLEMSSNDAILGSSLYAIETLMRRAEWRVDPYSETDTSDQEASQFVKECMDDMEASWSDTIAEIINFLRFGWGLHEEVFKLRQGSNRDKRFTSKYSDGLIGWRKLPIRGQETVFRWDIDYEDGTIWGMWQQPPPDYQLRYVSLEKASHFRTTINKNNPEGRSILRTAYRPWYFKRRLEEIEAIGLERDLAGMPVLQPPEEIDIFDTNDPAMVDLLQTATDMVSNIRRDELEGVVLPANWSLTLLSAGGAHGQSGRSSSGGGKANVGSTIARYESHMAMSMLADFIMLGHEQTGTFALSSDKTDMFNQSVNAWLDYVASVFNAQAVPRLMALNPRFPQDRMPRIRHNGVDTPNISEVGAYIQTMTGCGVLVPDPGLEDYVRGVANLPTRPDDESDDEWMERHNLVSGDDLEAEQAAHDDTKQQVQNLLTTGPTSGQQARPGAHRSSNSSSQANTGLKRPKM
jgi:hypothetical protein